MMAQEYETFREVGIGIGGLQKQMSIYGGIFAAVVAVGLGGYSLLFSKIDRLEESSARVEERLIAMDATLQKIAGDASAMKAGVDQVVKQTASISPTSLPGGFKYFDVPIATVGDDSKLIGAFFVDGNSDQLKEPTAFKASYEALTDVEKYAVTAACASVTAKDSTFCERLNDSRM